MSIDAKMMAPKAYIVEGILLFVGILFLRGTFIAEMYFNAALASIFIFSAILINFKLNKVESKLHFFIVGLLLVFIIGGIISIFKNPESSTGIMKSVLTFLIPVFLFLLIPFTSKRIAIAFKLIILLDVILIISYVLTLIIFAFSSKLYFLFGINYDYYIDAKVYFPFTILYGGAYNAGSVFIPRLLGIYREGGIAQIMFFYCFLQVDYLFNTKRKILKWVLLFGVLITFSTAGLATAIFMIGHLYLDKKDWKIRFSTGIYISIFAVLLLLGALFAPHVGLIDKSSGASYDYRADAQDNAWSIIMDRPFLGSGYLNDVKNTPPTNLLASIYQFGIPLWSGLVIIYLSGVISCNKRTLQKLVEFTPLVLTLFFSQPLYFQPLFILYMSWWIKSGDFGFAGPNSTKRCIAL
ncbi:O-antigen ligase family protein [Reichenbachiella ulvae]|uniref:O-antigen ligase-related domain-containing protein n=1 Tax=Reichenbachiella ulvae TaxID=2980104 RepID=A0ABT3CXR0_9BACT|nr:O-antigen ligase family protein [Reichenbachiella ulvae]MCV9388488.1 hypothetical protein [Reichenbachiella ulvae]